jgi:predicted DNA-binding protein with PD1-like motif
LKYSQGKLGRVFVLRLEDGDRLPQVVESFAKEHRIASALCILIGGVESGGKIVVGPERGDQTPPVPMIHHLEGVHEVLGVGTIFSTKDKRPILHMHAALGREGGTKAGCIRPGVDVWKIGEVLIIEIVETGALREKDAETGFDMLEV